VNTKYLCMDTATFYLTEKDRLNNDDASARIGCSETSAGSLTLTLEAKSCYLQSTSVNYRINYKVETFDTEN
jgi:hypothetical protein